MDIEKLKDMLRNAAGGPVGIQMCQEAADALEQLQAENDRLKKEIQQMRWIPVEERLPEEKQRVIVRCERVGTSVGWILWGNWMTDIGPHAGDVTHWMPLPAPPDKDNHVPAKAPNEPLTLEQLREMNGQPVWVKEINHWALIDIETGGRWSGIPFAVWAENGAKFCYNIKARNLHCYRCQPKKTGGNAE